MISDGFDTSEVLAFSLDHKESEWILDSGCSFRMTPNRDWFETLEEGEGSRVIMGK